MSLSGIGPVGSAPFLSPYRGLVVLEDLEGDPQRLGHGVGCAVVGGFRFDVVFPADEGCGGEASGAGFLLVFELVAVSVAVFGVYELVGECAALLVVREVLVEDDHVVFFAVDAHEVVGEGSPVYAYSEVGGFLFELL